MSTTQENILAYLKDHPRKSIVEVAEGLGANHYTLQASMRGLRNAKLVRVCGKSAYAKLYELVE